MEMYSIFFTKMYFVIRDSLFFFCLTLFEFLYFEWLDSQIKLQ